MGFYASDCEVTQFLPCLRNEFRPSATFFGPVKLVPPKLARHMERNLVDTHCFRFGLPIVLVGVPVYLGQPVLVHSRKPDYTLTDLSIDSLLYAYISDQLVNLYFHCLHLLNFLA